MGVVLHGRGPSGSLRCAVLDGGVPAVIYEAGGPLRFGEDEITRGVEGGRNVMAELQMIAETPEQKLSDVYWKTTWVRAAKRSVSSCRVGGRAIMSRREKCSAR